MSYSDNDHLRHLWAHVLASSYGYGWRLYTLTAHRAVSYRAGTANWQQTYP